MQIRLIEGVLEGVIHRRDDETGLIYSRPPIDPIDADEEGFPAVDMEARGLAAGSDTEVNGSPGAVGQLDQVRMPGVLHGVRTASVAQDRIVRRSLERAVERSRAGDRHRVPPLGAAFGQQQVPPAVDRVEVRSLRVSESGALP